MYVRICLFIFKGGGRYPVKKLKSSLKFYHIFDFLTKLVDLFCFQQTDFTSSNFYHIILTIFIVAYFYCSFELTFFHADPTLFYTTCFPMTFQCPSIALNNNYLLKF